MERDDQRKYFLTDKELVESKTVPDGDMGSFTDLITNNRPFQIWVTSILSLLVLLVIALIS
jgi:hypothetical protein